MQKNTSGNSGRIFYIIIKLLIDYSATLKITMRFQLFSS